MRRTVTAQMVTLAAISALPLACASEPEGAQVFESSTEAVKIDTTSTYTIVGVQSGKCVTVAGASTANSAPLQLGTCSGATSQQFRAVSTGSGYFNLKNVNSGRCVDVASVSTSDGAVVQQYACGTGSNQQWSFTDVAAGAERLTARHSGKALDVSGQSTTDGARLVQWTVNDQKNQQFKLVVSEAAPTPTEPPGASRAFDSCRFHFGTNDSIAKSNSAIAQQLDLFTPGWVGTADTFNMQYVCDETKAGAALANRVPALVAYVAAFYAKRHDNLKDCNAPGARQDLCVAGAAYIDQHMSDILGVYESYARGFASCYGTSRPLIFMMEPDFYQYTGSSQSRPWSPAHAGQVMTQFVTAVKKYLPNAQFSLDISPWVAPNNGSDNGKSWYANFDMNLFSFINTSGGGTNAASTKIRSSNNMTWAGVHQVTGKPILADTGYGVNGASAGPDPAWDNAANINARQADGVVAVTQYNPASSWGGTLSAVRPQLKTPSTCP